MDFVKPISLAVWEQYHFADYSSHNGNKDPFFATLNINFTTSNKMTLMTALFNRVGPLVNIPALTRWSHATLFARPSWIPYPYVSIVVLSASVISIFLVSKLGFDVNPEFTIKGWKFHVVSILIQGIELGMDLASSVSAVALIIFGQPITGGCVLVFVVIQCAARCGVFHGQSKPVDEDEDASKPTVDTPPWLMRDNQVIKEIWGKIPKEYRALALKQNYYWVIKHIGYTAGMIALPRQALLTMADGLFKIYGEPILLQHIELQMKEEVDKENKKTGRKPTGLPGGSSKAVRQN